MCIRDRGRYSRRAWEAKPEDIRGRGRSITKWEDNIKKSVEGRGAVWAVSYTHLDVYKRQSVKWLPRQRIRITF